jgi:predicted RNA binding protein YcfA (HicA-like mRNA interferase family)
MTQKQLIKYLESEGYILTRAKTGTHMHFKKPGERLIITIKDRTPNEKVPKGAMAGILRRMGGGSLVSSDR